MKFLYVDYNLWSERKGWSICLLDILIKIIMINTEKITYSDHSGMEFEGVLSYDDNFSGKRPAILVSHALSGLTDFEIEKTIKLAEMGYLSFALDMYGKENRPSSREEASQLMGKLNSDRTLLFQRITLAYERMKKFDQVDQNKTAAIGFCFGGKCVLDLARSGADIKGVVSFHGVYDEAPGSSHTPIKAAVLVQHGWDDPVSPPDKLMSLGKELTERKADWRILAYGHTGHAFTNPQANSPERGVFYKESSDRRSWIAMKEFFRELFGE